jgi:uncharacterized membrane protein YhdT
MIQRIQTLFLALAFVAAMALFFFPLAGVYSDLHTYKLYVYTFRNLVPGEESVFSFMTTLPLLILNILTAGFSLVSIFLYKNRIRQIKYVRLGIFTDVVLIGLVFFIYARIVEKNLGASPNYLDEAGIYFPLIVMIFLILANKFIIKDERLVRSVDRLR